MSFDLVYTSPYSSNYLFDTNLILFMLPEVEKQVRYAWGERKESISWKGKVLTKETNSPKNRSVNSLTSTRTMSQELIHLDPERGDSINSCLTRR